MDKTIECSICKDDGLCKNNTKSPDYDDDFFGSDIYDCVEYLEAKEGKPKGSWMIEWGRNLKKNEQPYESDFVKWTRSLVKI